MASSSLATRLLIRQGKTAASLLLRARTANLTETVQNTGPAIRSLLGFNQTPASQYPVFSESFPVIQSNFRVGFIQQERIGKMEAGHGKEVVYIESEEETDFGEEEFGYIDEDDPESDDSDEEDDEVEEDEKDDKSIRKNK